MNKIAKEENLNVTGEVADVYNYTISSEYDLVLLDSMLHFYKNDMEKETNFIKRVASELKVGGLLCNFMLKGKKRQKHLKEVISGMDIYWKTIVDEYTNYTESDSKFHIFIIKKLGYRNK